MLTSQPRPFDPTDNFKKLSVPAAWPGQRRHEQDHFFTVDHLSGNLKRHAFQGSAITLIAQAGKLAVRLASTAVLARLLTPADFGLIAMVTVVVAFIDLFKDAGLSMATVQRPQLNHAQASTLFWINAGLGLVLMLALMALAPAIARFYGEPRLVPITLALAVAVAAGAAAVQHQALLRRRMQLGRIAIIDMVGLLVGSIVAIALAVRGFGYWSLVALPIVSAIATAVMSFALCAWRPGRPRFDAEVTGAIRFGGLLTLHQAAGHFFRTADQIVVGFTFGTAALGLYGKAYGLLLQPWAQVLAPIHAAVQPALCRAWGDAATFLAIYQRALTTVAVASFGTLLAAVLYAQLIVTFVLGDSWRATAPIFVAFAPAAAIFSVRTATTWIYVASGNVRHQLYVTLASGSVLLVAVLAAADRGPVGIATTVSLVQVTAFPVAILACARSTGVRLADIVRPIVPALCILAVASVIVVAGQMWHLDLRPAAVATTAIGSAGVLARLFSSKGTTR